MSIRSNQFVGLDFETYGAVSLPSHGLERYVADSTFQPLIASGYYVPDNSRPVRSRFRLWDNDVAEHDRLAAFIDGKYVVAHNAGFEKRVLKWLGMDELPKGYIDSAVLARAMGAAGKLEAAGPQLLDSNKMEVGFRLIKLFSIPSKEQVEDGDLDWDPNLIMQHAADWELFADYCDVDAELGLYLARLAYGQGFISESELKNQDITMWMNETGWPVDIDKVEEMQRRFLENQAAALEDFRSSCDPLDETLDPVTAAAKRLNLNSLKQMKEWCAARGVRLSSFDEKNVAKAMATLKRKLDEFDAGAATPKASQYEQYVEVLQLLETKQILGGSSLKKLKTILDTVSEDGRLRDQYMHVGAGATWRTTGRSVQMQNLKRLTEDIGDLDELDDPDSEWDNDRLAENIRQTFTSSDPNGFLIVGDFSSVEARGLPWLAGDVDKLDIFRKGQDVYKVGAAKQFGVAYDDVTKPQRQFGKVGELSCGYQAGPGAVKSFAEGMGVMLTEAEAASVVDGWRANNPAIVDLWWRLDQTLHIAFKQGVATATVGADSDNYVQIVRMPAPASLSRQHPGAVSLEIRFFQNEAAVPRWKRVIHGVYERGNSLCYYKPTERKTGDVWVNHYKDPKTKQVKFFSIYGGKLAGILTQSLCREIFFDVLREVAAYCDHREGIYLIGQFHDEIVLDWTTEAPVSRGLVVGVLKQFMSSTDYKGFPLEADVKFDYRYTK